MNKYLISGLMLFFVLSLTSFSQNNVITSTATLNSDKSQTLTINDRTGNSKMVTTNSDENVITKFLQVYKSMDKTEKPNNSVIYSAKLLPEGKMNLSIIDENSRQVFLNQISNHELPGKLTTFINEHPNLQNKNDIKTAVKDKVESQVLKNVK